jgi:hypothetical protein
MMLIGRIIAGFAVGLLSMSGKSFCHFVSYIDL